MSGENSALTWLPMLGNLALKSLFVFLVAGLALLALRRASASARHLVCLLTLAGLLVLPVLSLALPGWRLAVLPAPQSREEPTPRQVAAPPETGGGRVSEGAGAASRTPIAPAATSSVLNSSSSRFGRTPASEANKEVGFPWPLLLASLWLGGVLLAGLRPLLGLWGIARLSQTSAAVLDAHTLALIAECASALGLSRTPALYQAGAPVPMTWGWRHPVVLLPADAGEWPEERLRVVLLHELAHIQRRDWLSHRFADFVCALYWFHPLVWLIARRLRAEGEIACDDLVLTSGVAAPDYARYLLDVARTLRPASAVPQAAIGMARTARIEGRLTMILDTTRPRRALTRRALLIVLSLSAVALVPLAVLRLGARDAAPGTPIHDASAPLSPSAYALQVPPYGRQIIVAPGGDIPIQLVGMTGLSSPKWWDERGRPFGPLSLRRSPAWHALDVKNPERRVLLAFRLPASAKDVTVKYDLTDCEYTSSDGTWQLKTQSTSQKNEAQLNAQSGGARILTATFPAPISRTNARVGTASGPWKIIETARRDASGQIEGMSAQRGSNGYIFSPLAGTKDGTLLTVSVGGPSSDDIRLVAVNDQGHDVLPSEIGDSSIGTLDQITAHFALLPTQIKEIRVETRPFRYVEFKNVAVRPAK